MNQPNDSIIKVIGVGGGGSNAVTHMFRKGIVGVDFIICNTDRQALENSPVPTKITLGEKGTGAGAKPEVGKSAAIGSIDNIKTAIGSQTEMVFITAGMGGGTGTGAAPVVAEECKKMGLLTVGIVTTPFMWEGPKRKRSSKDGIQELKDCVDTLIIISNDKLRNIYGNLNMKEAFAKADDVLAIAAKGIAEIITVNGMVNVDFEDVKTVMEKDVENNNGGVAIMGTGRASGEGRAMKAVKEAMESPLLNDNDIKGAKNILLNITTDVNGITMDEFAEISDFIQQEAGGNADIIWGNCIDEDMEDEIKIVLIATGFPTKQDNMWSDEPQVKKVNLNAPVETVNRTVNELNIKTTNVEPTPVEQPKIEPTIEETPKKDERVTVVGFDEYDYDSAIKKHEESITIPENKKINWGKPHKVKSNIDDDTEQLKKELSLRRLKLERLGYKTSSENVDQLKNQSAFKRKNIDLEKAHPSNEHLLSDRTVGENSETNYFGRNKFLHQDVD